MAFVMPFFAAIGSAAGASAATAGAAGLALTSGAFSVLGAVQQGRQASAAAKSQANMDEYNATMAEFQAREANASAGRQEDEQRQRARQTIGAQLAASAQAGAGLNTDLLRQSVYNMEADSSAIRYEGALRAQGLTDSAALSRSSAVVSRDSARGATSAGYLNAAGSLLNTGTSYYRASNGVR